MRNNQPVYDRETMLPEGEFIYSRTDLKGVITEANEAFATISAFEKEEMLGQSHNLVRHPDMPPEAFEDMWRDLKAGRPWSGVVKNRRKDGGYYWVVANASPVRENGQIIGYQSVRTCPTRAQIAAASAAYERIKAGDRSIRIAHGRVVANRISPLTAFNSLRGQCLTLGSFCLLASLMLLLGSFSIDIPPAVQQAVAGVGLLSGLYFLLFIMPCLFRDIASVNDYIESMMRSGDLRQRFSPRSNNQIGEIGRRMENFVASMQATIQIMADAAHQVTRVSEEVAQGMSSAREAANVQSDATATAAAGIEQITVSISEVAEHASATRDTAHSASEVAMHGSKLSEQATSNILALAETVKVSAQQVEFLGQQSAEISRITGVIRDIADQTNLLALNAAIEAARAGEQGRGFAVVADEVRKLAERTGQATKEISTMIQSIQAETEKAVQGMRSGAVQVEDGVHLVQDAQSSLREITEQMQETLRMVNDITHSSAEQQEAMTTMAQSVERVAGMTEHNVAMVNQTHSAVDYLNQLISRMQKAIRQYAV